MGQVLTVEQARAAGIGSSYPDTDEGNAQLDERIVAVERWLATRIGPLFGPIRAERLNTNGGARLWLSRPAADGTLVVSTDGTALDASVYFVEHTLELVRVDGNYWTGRIVYSYTPADEFAVREAVLSLLRLELSATGMQSETISGSSYAYTRGDGKGELTSRESVVAALLPGGMGVGA